MFKYLAVVTILNLQGTDKQTSEFYNCPNVGRVQSFENWHGGSPSCSVKYTVKVSCTSETGTTTTFHSFVVCNGDLREVQKK